MTEIKKPMLATYYDKSRVKFPCMVEPKYDGCLQGGSKIITADGIMTIRDIVENKIETKVLSYSKTDGLCFKQIVNRFNNGEPNIEWYTIHTIGRELTCTGNHKVFTKRGFIPAEELREDDMVLTKQLSDFGKEILSGMLFGDSCLHKDKSETNCWRTRIASNNIDFLKHKISLLGLNASEIKNYESGYGSICVKAEIEALTPYINPMDYVEFRSGKWQRRKCIRVKELLKMLSDNSLSVWYADDGSISYNNGNKNTPVIHLNTHRYTIEQLREFIKYFVIKYDCCPTIVKDKRVCKNKESGYGGYLVFTTEDTFKLLEVLRKRVIKGVEYKYYYDNYSYMDGNPTTTEYRKIESIHVQRRKIVRYDLEIEDTHCYFANGILVHNCRALCLIGKDNEVHLLSRGGKELNVPHIKEWAEEHREFLPLDGELYNHDELSFQQICSAVKCYSPLTDKLKFVVYDMPVSGYTNGMRRILLQRMFNFDIDSPVYLTVNKTAHSENEVAQLHDLFVANGYEGAIIRNMDGKYTEGRSNNLMKLKKFDTTEFEIIDVLEAEGQDKGTALFKLRSGNYTFHARPTGSRELRTSYLRDREELIGKLCTIRHFGYTDGGVIPRFPVALGIRDYE